MLKHAEERSWRSLFTPKKLTFYTLFHGFHLAIFIVGWYVLTDRCYFTFSNIIKVQANHGKETCRIEPVNILCMDLSRRGIGLDRRHHIDHAANVPEYLAIFSTKSQVASIG